MTNTEDQNNELTGLPSVEGSDGNVPAARSTKPEMSSEMVQPQVEIGEKPAVSATPAFDLSSAPAPIMSDEQETAQAETSSNDAEPNVESAKINESPNVPSEAEKVEPMVTGIKLEESKTDAPDSSNPVEPEVEKAEPVAETAPENSVNNPVPPAPEPESNNMVMQGAMPGSENKSHLGLYIGAAVFVLLLGGGAYAYMSNWFGIFGSESQVVETAMNDESDADETLNAAADDTADEEQVEDVNMDEMSEGEMMVDDESMMMEDETMIDDAMMENEAIIDENSAMMEEPEMVDETMPEDEMTTDEMMFEDVSDESMNQEVENSEPPKVRRVVPTSEPEESPDAMTETEGDTIAMIDKLDCGSDMGCFIEAANNCSPATVSQMVLGVDGTYEITGGDTTTCDLLTTAAGYQQECSFPQENLMEVVNRWAIGEYSTDDYDSAECTVL